VWTALLRRLPLDNWRKMTASAATTDRSAENPGKTLALFGVGQHRTT
jgi:hypothetical protein